MFINVEVDAAADPAVAAKLAEVCPVDIFADDAGRVQVVAENLDEVREVFDEYNSNDMPVYFKVAELGEDYGVIGAAELVRPTAVAI